MNVNPAHPAVKWSLLDARATVPGRTDPAGRLGLNIPLGCPSGPVASNRAIPWIYAQKDLGANCTAEQRLAFQLKAELPLP